MKELSWEQGYIVKFKETADVEGKKAMVIDFTVSAKILKVGNAVFEQNWPAKWLSFNREGGDWFVLLGRNEHKTISFFDNPS